MDYLETAILEARKAVETASDDDPDWSNLLAAFAVRLGDKCTATKDRHDHADRINRLMFLTYLLNDKLMLAGEMDDLDEAISVAQHAVDEMPEDHPQFLIGLTTLSHRLRDNQALEAMPDDHQDRSEQFGGLSNLLASRYLSTGATEDLGRAIQMVQNGVDSMIHGNDSQKPLFLQHLGGLLGLKPLRTGFLADAVAMPLSGDDNRGVILNALGHLLASRCAVTGALADLNEAISLTRQAVDTPSNNQTVLSQRLGNLAVQLQQRFLRTKAAPDLEESSELSKRAMEMLLDDHPDQSRHRHDLGIKLARKFTITNNIADLEAGIQCIRLALERMPHDHANRAVYLHSLANGLIQKGSETFEPTDVDEWIASWGRAPRRLCTLRQPNAPTLCRIRACMSLLSINPDWKESLEAAKLVMALLPRLTPRSLDNEDRQNSLSEIAGLASDAAAVAIQCEDDFLRAPGMAAMQDATDRGPIAIINVSVSDRIQTISLTGLSLHTIEEKVLEWLWDTVAAPALDALGFTQPLSDNDKWPHMWWILTGLLRQFPLHAAGYHRKRSAETVMDKVMSSYGSSVKAILRGRERRVSPKGSTTAVLVAMEHIPARSNLPFADAEIKVPHRLKEEVMTGLQSSTIFHFAAHGSTNQDDPLESFLCLEDVRSNPLRVADLLNLNLKENPPFLAYLSACGTGRIQQERHMDESMHLVSACQLAGFRHVIGTLWEVNDEICVETARITYEGIGDGKMAGGKMADESVFHGLHVAVRRLRDAGNRQVYCPGIC
ncbi:CHAT domain-containing protein [Ilyonectria robusta]|uniref:CHAT domain-containing protein n=1 Tax=Ilyonectria robusta TaxID=1079257 RepID=UPI001E8D896E|nr:CHAT domain-containing protein [Ilyonectria robusta]KAH8650484.1 CHAT domain-containing protein [Ilyonectria robusta]